MKKSINLVQGLSIVVGMIIGSGIFLKPAIVLKDAGNPIMALAAWILGGIITLASALTIAEIASNIPRAGGLYTYLEELYGERWGFLLGWVQTVISYPASVAAQAIAFSIYASYFIPMTDWQQRLLGIGVLALLLLLNILSTRCGAVIQMIATVGKLIPIAAILIVGLINGVSDGALGVRSGLIGNTGTAILGTLWAYDGWISVTNMAGEMKNPKKNMPRAIIIGMILVIAVYALFNVVIFNTLSADVLADTEKVGIDVSVALFGEKGATFLTAGIMVSVFGALNGYLMTAARVPHAMAERRMLPAFSVLGKINKRFDTPANSLILQAALAVIYICTGTFNTLTDLLVFVLWIFFTLGVFGIFILRRRKMSSKEGYRVPLYPVVPAIGVAGGAFILISTLIDSPVRSLIGIGITLVGIPVYEILRRRNAKSGS